MIDLIKSIFGVPKKNGIYIIVISLALQLCLIDRDFKLNLDKFLFSNDNSYDIIKICIQYNYAIIVVLICLGIFLESLYSLLFTIDIHQSNVTDKNLLYKHKKSYKEHIWYRKYDITLCCSSLFINCYYVNPHKYWLCFGVCDCSNFVVSTDFLFDFIYTFYCRESLRILYIQGLLALYLPAPAPLQALSLCMINPLFTAFFRQYQLPFLFPSAEHYNSRSKSSLFFSLFS